jgi:hypothetical protein
MRECHGGIDAVQFPAHNPGIMAKGNSQKQSNGSALDFEAHIWAAAQQAVPAAHLEMTGNCLPFNMSDWGGQNLRQDARCFSLSASIGERAGVRCRVRSLPANNANYGWIQHCIHHLAFNGNIDGRQTLN